MSPLAVLHRGYSVTRFEDGSVVSSVCHVKAGDKVNVLLSDGEAEAEILSVNQK